MHSSFCALQLNLSMHLNAINISPALTNNLQIGQWAYSKNRLISSGSRDWPESANRHFDLQHFPIFFVVSLSHLALWRELYPPYPVTVLIVRFLSSRQLSSGNNSTQTPSGHRYAGDWHMATSLGALPRWDEEGREDIFSGSRGEIALRVDRKLESEINVVLMWRVWSWETGSQMMRYMNLTANIVSAPLYPCWLTLLFGTGANKPRK